MARKVTAWSENNFVQNRYAIWFGSDMPKTISAKEICDNALDQISDHLATHAYINIQSNGITVMDNGNGISFKKDKESGKTHLFLAVGKLYTSSNYEGTSNLVGTNGVGCTATNFLSKEFMAGQIKDNSFKGYIFHNGNHYDEGESFDTINDFHLDVKEVDLSYGFYVKAEYNDEILEDPINTPWLLNYIEKRVGELPEGAVVIVEHPNFDGDIKRIEFNKIIGSEHYIKSWEEQINDIPDSQIVKVTGGWKYAFSKKSKAFENISSMIQGAPVQNNNNFNGNFDIEDMRVRVNIPFSVYYSGKINPRYTDQTKRKVTISSDSILSTLKSKANDIYIYYYNLAKESYLNHILETNKGDAFWPALGKPENQELIIAEGNSAISGIKNMRNPETQACICLRGKILNVIQKDIKDAMKSPIIKNLLTILTQYRYKRIIIAVDADTDGSHICSLLLGLFSKFCRTYLEEGRIYYCHTPLYVFRKGKKIEWSDKVADCPKGYHINVKKGLGSLEPDEIEMFITNPDTRDLWQFEYDNPKADEKLWFALAEGGKGWIIE